MTLAVLELPITLNYIGLFLTLDCNLNCSYCINDPTQTGQRSKIFPISPAGQHRHLTPEQWVAALNRIPASADLPITLQGGEPMLYWKGRGLGEILCGVDHHFDLLTNFALPPDRFAQSIRGQEHKLKRDAPYPSIRVSYHAEEMNRTWQNRGFSELVDRCVALSDHGFRVSAIKHETDVGIYMVAHPDNQFTTEMQQICHGRVHFETKEFLGVHEGQLFGHYLYPLSTDLIARKIASSTLTCECRTTELLIDPLGFVWGCHYYLYASWERGGPVHPFERLSTKNFRFTQFRDELFEHGDLHPIGHLLDPDFTIEALSEFRPCAHYGRCIGCDTKIKNDRFQSYYDRGVPHTSVQMRNIKFPRSLHPQVAPEELQRIAHLLHPEYRP